MRHYPEKSRHAMALALAGMLLRAGWSDEEAERFIELVAEEGGSRDVPTKVKAVADTRAKLEDGAEVTGLTRLKEIIGNEVGNAVGKFLGTKPERQEYTPEPAPWPTPDPRMFHGIAGEFVALVEPHTEADPVALLLQFLVASGSALGRSAYYTVEGARHHGNLFGVIVGQTSKGRKGTSWQHVGNLMYEADQVWREGRVVGGLSSGEGLIWEVRDAITKTETKRDEKGKKIAGQYEEVVTDAGVDDKRLLVLETEFASTLRVMKRDGSTLSAVIRQAWDSGDLRSLTKNSRAKATGAHISIIGHITADELRRELDRTEVANGFLNRFLLVCVKRSKLLPDGGNVDQGQLAVLGRKVGERLRQFDFKDCELRRDDAARERWHQLYAELSEGKPGLFGAVTSRSEAQVTRLAACMRCSTGPK